MDDGLSKLDDEEEEEDYDLEPEDDELDMLHGLGGLDDEESDELDDMDDPRIVELGSDEEAPALTSAPEKGRNKRPAEDSDDEADLHTLMNQSIKRKEPTTNGVEKPLSKSQKKKLQKKLKQNNGEAADVDGKDTKKETNGEKKVQFAANLEQGPTPSTKSPATDAKKSNKADQKDSKKAKVWTSEGVTIDDRKVGEGHQAKKGSQVELRYIGKLPNGKVFDGECPGSASTVH